MGTCSSCNKAFDRVNLTPITASHPNRAWNALSYDCPHCGVSLSVGIDPIAIRTDITAAIANQSRQSSFR